jgi:membrane carboxypeptidase/penicillin-binding protein
LKKIISKIALKFFADDLAVVVTNIDLAATSPVFSSIPFEVIALLAAIEDRKFFIHDGYDVFGMIRAVQVFFFRSKLEGASTIEQQLVRVLTDRRELTLYRKFREICLASAVSFLYEKSVIARSYLYYGYPLCQTTCRVVFFKIS